jgi:hypothetical protein
MAKERDEATIAKLKELSVGLFSGDITKARLAGRSLSWMQDDGLLILKQALFGDFSRTTKKAAAYGLRSMQGRMKKLGIEVLEQGMKNRDATTKAACKKSLKLIREAKAKKRANIEKDKQAQEAAKAKRETEQAEQAEQAKPE